MTEMRIWLLIPFTLFVAASAAAAQEVTAGGTAQAHAITLTLGKVFLFLFVTLEPFNVLGPFASMMRGRDNVIKRRLAMQGSSIAAIAVVVAATVGAMISSPRRCCWWLVSGRTGKILVRLVYPQVKHTA